MLHYRETQLEATMQTDSISQLQSAVRAFAEARDWQPFHTPKNLAMALAVEAAELMEHFQWDTAEQSQQPDAAKQAEIGAEMSDVLIYLIRMADVMGIDLLAAAQAKLQHNGRKYPVEQARGNAKKYTQLQPDEPA
jgi:NTP pyrophosphatase (non-canonical NTP hydrolase)